MDEIIKNLYVGNLESRLSVDSDFVILSICDVPVLVDRKHYVFPIEDDVDPSPEDIAKYNTILKETSEIIRETLKDPTKKVLVHCAAGRQRSAGVVAYYLAFVSGRFKGSDKLDEAIFHVMTKRLVAFRDMFGNMRVHWKKSLESAMAK